jgi:uncharacterized membrane protein
MSEDVKSWLELIFRWVHVIAGVMWIGHLYFFNFVNAQVAKTYDADSKKKVVPELMPRALYWFRWGAAYTWVTGILLFVFVYMIGAAQSGMLIPLESGRPIGMGHGIVFGTLIAGWVIYDLLWKSLEKKETVGAAVSFVLASGLIIGLHQIFAPRAAYILLGATFGTIMAANVWMRIWPAQRRIISAIKAGTAPDGALVARAGLRSKHNTYMSVPLIFTMISNHYPAVYGSSLSPFFLIALVALGWGMTKMIYSKSGTPVPAQFEPSAAAASPPGGAKA